MIYKKELQKSILIVCFFVFGLVVFAGALLFIDDDSRSLMKKYEQFLNGDITADSGMGEKKNVGDFLGNEDMSYLYLDIDCDGQPELHIRSASFYYILKYERDALQTIYSGTPYAFPVKYKNLCGVLYFRHGGAPEHKIYYFTSFQNGEKVTGPEYAWYDLNENHTMDTDDWFFRDDIEQDMNTWKDETEAYRESQGIEAGWMKRDDSI